MSTDLWDLAMVEEKEEVQKGPVRSLESAVFHVLWQFRTREDWAVPNLVITKILCLLDSTHPMLQTAVSMESHTPSLQSATGQRPRERAGF
jgi:hypothetical protein